MACVPRVLHIVRHFSQSHDEHMTLGINCKIYITSHPIIKKIKYVNCNRLQNFNDIQKCVFFSLLVEKRFCTMRHYLDKFLYIINGKTNKPNRNALPVVIKEFKNELP